MDQNFMRKVIRMGGKALSLGLLAFASLKSGSAWAACYLAGPIIIMSVDGPAAGTVVDSTLPPGAEVGAGASPSDEKISNFVCTGGGAGNSNPLYLKTNLLTTLAPSGLYEFTVGGRPSGVGMRLYLSSNGGPFEPMPVTRQLNLPDSTDPRNNVPSYTAKGQFKATMERTTNPVVYGPVDKAGLVGASVFYNGVGEVGDQNRFINVNVGSITFVRPSCAIDAGSLTQTVDLGRYSTRDLTDPSSSTRWAPFEFTMANCDDPTGRLVDITFGSAADRDSNNPNLFSLNMGGPTGIGIALSTDDDADTAVLPGTVSTYPGVATGGSYKFRARMQRTPAALTAGEVNRPVTVLVDYR
jgi:type 1 fimbria pilin